MASMDVPADRPVAVPAVRARVAQPTYITWLTDRADNGVYTGIVIVVAFWLGVFMSARGGTGGIAKLASSRLLIGTLIPGAVLVDDLKTDDVIKG